jgi:hypothetical protein
MSQLASITSAEGLENRVGRLEKAFTDYSGELQHAYEYIRKDVGSSLTKSRIVLEKLVVRIFVQVMGKEPKKPLLADMLSDNQFTRKIDPPRIRRLMDSIRNLANPGPHGEAAEASDAARVLDALCDVLEWYLQRYSMNGSSGAPSTTPPGLARSAKPVKSRRRRLWLSLALGVLGSLAVAAVLAAVLSKGPPLEAESVEEPSKPQAAPTVAKVSPFPVVVELGLEKPPARSDDSATAKLYADTRVTYEYRRTNDTLHVTYRLPYLERQRAGKSIGGVYFQHVPFDWSLPVLSVKVLNNSDKTVLLTECLVKITSSSIDTEPVLVVSDQTVNGLLLINEGWGDVIDPVLTFKIHRIKKGEQQDTAKPQTLTLQTFAKDKMVRLGKYVPKELQDESIVAVKGELEFGPAKRRKKVPFATTMLFDSTFEAPVPASQQYDLALTAGKAPDTLRVPIAHSLKPGEADQFLLRIASDKSAHYALKLTIRRIGDGQELPEQKVALDVFVPRSASKRVVKAEAVERPAGSALGPKKP